MPSPAEPLLHMSGSSHPSCPAPLSHQGCATPNSHLSDPQDLRGTPLKARDPQTLTISWRPAQPCRTPSHWAILPSPACASHTPKAGIALQELRLAGPCYPALHELCFAHQVPKACTALQELHLAGLRSLTLHDLCFAGHAPKACTVLHNIHSAKLCP
jgi:hypothetical protein